MHLLDSGEPCQGVLAGYCLWWMAMFGVPYFLHRLGSVASDLWDGGAVARDLEGCSTGSTDGSVYWGWCPAILVCHAFS